MKMDSTISCIPSTLNFACDVDGVHTEIPIPANAWDFENETVWLTQAQLAELYKTSVPNICARIGNILEDEELQADSTIKECLIVRVEGGRICSVSYLKHCERISRCSDLNNVDIPTETGAVKATSPMELPRLCLESTHIGRDSSLCFLPQVAENENPRKQTTGERNV